MQALTMHTPNLADENFRRLAALFPHAVTETINEAGEVVRAIDADVLRQEISAAVVEGQQERYQFTWPDKKKSVVLANAPIAKTLRLDRARSMGRDGTPGSIDTENLYIEGDNLDALKLLRETYLGKVKLIYIDPPYNTGNNLIYKNDYKQTTAEYLSNSGQFDDAGNYLVQNPTTNGRFHTDWLNMIYPRLRIAKDLLAEDGVLAVAIDENEFATLSLILKQIFSENSYEHSYVTVVHNPRGQQGNNFSYVHENLIFVYPGDGRKYISDFPKDEVDARNLRDSGTSSDRTNAKNCFYPFFVKNGKIVGIGDVPPDSFHPDTANIIRKDGITEVWPISESGDEKKWRYARQSVDAIFSHLEAKRGRSSIQIIYNKGEGTMRSVWANARYDASEYGTKLVQTLLGDSSFTYPKSLYAVYDAIRAACWDSDNGIVMDFFSGSATTAHAVMKFNAENNKHLQYIMVQVQEEIDNDSEAYKSGYKTICDIGEERIRCAGKKILDEVQATDSSGGYKPDIGFRVLRVDSTNMQDVYYRPQDYEQQALPQMADNVKPDRTPEDLLIQVMLELGVPLSSTIAEEEIAGRRVFSVADGYLLACFDAELSDEVVTAIARRRPFYAVLRDSGLASDSVAVNFEQIFQAHSPQTRRKVL